MALQPYKTPVDIQFLPSIGATPFQQAEQNALDSVHILPVEMAPLPKPMLTISSPAVGGYGSASLTPDSQHAVLPLFSSHTS